MLDIGGLSIELDLAGGASLRASVERYRPFAVAGDADITLAVEPHPDPPGQDEPYDGLDVEFRREGGALTAVRRDFELELDEAARSGRALVSAQPAALSSALRIVAAQWLPALKDTILLHAGGVVAGGRAWVFFGRSGAGKSTAVGQLTEWPVLSDEIVAIRVTPGGIVACATPFSGALDLPGRPAAAPLGGLHLLEKTEDLESAELATGEARGALMRCVLMFGDPGPSAGKVLELVSILVESLPVIRLGVPRAGALRDYVARVSGEGTS